MEKTSRYKNKLSGQVSRKRRKHREANQPRLEQLKELFGCYHCGRGDVPGRYLDGHHLHGKAAKHKALSHLCGGPWRKIVDEILGIDREKGRSGGPVVMVCQRYHEDEINYGKCAKPCTHPCFKNVPEPYRVKTRLPGRIRGHVENDMLDNSVRRIERKSHSSQENLSLWGCLLGKLKNRITSIKDNRNA